MTIGEIYTHLVRYLYRKFTTRKKIPLDNDDFIRVLERIGKLAWQTLISGKYSLQSKMVIEEIGDYAFDYGLNIEECKNYTCWLIFLYGPQILPEVWSKVWPEVWPEVWHKVWSKV